MLFNSLEFALFFPCVTALYFLLPHRARWMLLLLASCFFYMAFVPAYILILLFTIAVDYCAGIWIENARGTARKWLLALSLAANIGVLAVFKYYGFLASNAEGLLGFLGIKTHWPALNIILPIGLSFHTFQAMSYTIEVYRGNQKAERHFGIYALYVMFYPQLVAGPIERPQNLLHQFREEHSFDPARATRGIKLMAQGLFKKVVIADQLSVAVNLVFDDPARQTGTSSLLAILYFAFQIYFDFSGYSDIALGSAEVMGFKLMKNFDTPYFSASIGEFWRRWHISLSTWFRDYLYVPLGGSRVSLPRRCLNVMIVFLVSGLWHGANWTYVVWGSMHGGMIVLENLFGGSKQSASHNPLRPAAQSVWWALGVVRTFTLVSIAWVFFRARSFSDAWTLLANAWSGIVSLPHWWLSGRMWSDLRSGSMALNLMLIGSAVLLEALDRRKNLWQRLGGWPVLPRYAAYYAVIYVTLLTGLGHTETQFIYFQF
jgi:D-alanyl-lipoteichoic acid acyltransferase DltB (MBOAT superfamily)